MNLYSSISRRREKRRAWEENSSNRSCCRVSPGDELVLEGQICMAVPTIKPIHPAGTRAGDIPSRWLPPAHDITAVLVWLDSAKISALFPSRGQVLAVLSHVAEHFALFCGSKRFCSDPPSGLLQNISLQPYLKDTGLQRGEKVQQGTPSKALIFSD